MSKSAISTKINKNTDYFINLKINFKVNFILKFKKIIIFNHVKIKIIKNSQKKYFKI